MTLQDVMEAMEGHRFAAEVNLAAGLDAFDRGVQDHSSFPRLGRSDEGPKRPQDRSEALGRTFPKANPDAV